MTLKRGKIFSAASLAGYKRALEKNGVLRDMRHFRKLPGLMENPRLLPVHRMAANIVGDLFTVDGGQSTVVNYPVTCEKIGLVNRKDGIKGLRQYEFGQ